MPSIENFRMEILLSFQCALWDMVTPALRGVAVRPVRPVIYARFIFDHEPTEDEIQIVAEVETYVVADFTAGTDVNFSAVGIAPDIARELLSGEEWIYLRREDSPDL